MSGQHRRFIGIFLAAGALLLWAGIAGAETEYPVLSQCTGEGVRLREDPSTEAKIVGKVDYETLYAVGETSVEGEVWYEVLHPTQTGTAWIYGKFLDVNYFKNITPAQRLTWKIALTFGCNEARARSLFGRPQKEKRTMTFIEGAGEKLPDVTLTYPTHTAQYVDDILKNVTVAKGTMPFGPFRIGDPASGLADLMGEPGDTSEGQWSYELGPVEYLTFKVKDDRIAAMEYSSWFD